MAVESRLILSINVIIKNIEINKGEIMMENKMFCYQCQETVGNQGCSQVGVCGKTPETAGLQDLLIDVTKGLAEVINEVRCKGKEIK